VYCAVLYCGELCCAVLSCLGPAGPVVMDMSGFTEKGLQRKVAVQALFTKLLYLSEVRNLLSLSTVLFIT